ncbi:hypothetical protein DB30_07567 [Enhygromyxa salina]|uniref:Uncharacterized protein n=2 Tax=Enhygromyxa salina TaxID=215803 RepID=A0A0C2CRD4_9BACT|nr:hypothetical protein DB30_07567 [Enhygromyxa salina]
MASEPSSMTPPTWLINIRHVVYFAARYWWAVALAMVLLARISGATWAGACVLGLLALVAVVAAPAGFGVLVAVVSRRMNRRPEI